MIFDEVIVFLGKYFRYWKNTKSHKWRRKDVNGVVHVPDEDKTTERDRGKEECISPESFSIKNQKHQKRYAGMTWEKEVIASIVEEIIEEKSDTLIAKYELIRMSPEMREHDKKSSGNHEKWECLDEEEHVLWLQYHEKYHDECKEKRREYDESLDRECWDIAQDDVLHHRASSFYDIVVSELLKYER